MKKIICVLVLVVCFASLLTGCYTCDICHENKVIFDRNKEEVFGNTYYYCNDCEDKLEEVGEALKGFGN